MLRLSHGRKLLHAVVFATLLAGLALQAGPAALVSAAPGKISFTPDGTTVTEGTSVDVTVALDSPITAGTPPGSVQLDLVSSDSSRVTVTPSSLMWSESDWNQPKTFSVSVIDDAVHNTGNDVTISAVADSNSTYYDGFAISLAVTVTDDEPAPSTPSPSPSPTPSSGTTTPASKPAAGGKKPAAPPPQDSGELALDTVPATSQQPGTTPQTSQPQVESASDTKPAERDISPWWAVLIIFAFVVTAAYILISHFRSGRERRHLLKRPHR